MWSVVEGNQWPGGGCADVVVVPDGGGHRQDPLGHADGHAFEAAAAVLLQAELSLEGVVYRLDELANRFQRWLTRPGLLPLERGPQQCDAAGGQVGFELLG